MPITNNIVRFRKEDYPQSPDWWNRAIFALNLLIDYIFNTATSLSNLTAKVDKIPNIKTFMFIKTSDAASTTNPENNKYTFQNLLAVNPSQLFIYATNNTIPIFTSPVWASWHSKNGFISIDAITGLANSTQYTFTVTLIY